MGTEPQEPEETNTTSTGKANKGLWITVLLLGAAILVLLPIYLRQGRRYSEQNVGFELTELYTPEPGSGNYVFKADVKNNGKETFDQVEGDLEIYVHGKLAGEYHCTMSGRVEPGQTSHFDFGTKDYNVDDLQRIGPMDYKFVWKLTFARYIAENGMMRYKVYDSDQR